MNFKGYIVALVISFALGYFIYPVLFLPNEPKQQVFTENVKVRGPEGKLSFDIDVREVKPEEVPEKVKAKESITLKAVDGGMSITLEKGATAKVKSFTNGILELTDPSGKFSGQATWDQTDFTSGVAENRIKEMFGDPDADKKAKQKAIQEKRKQARALADQRKAERAESEEKPEKPKEEKTPEAGPLTKKVSDEEILTLMKGSVKSKAVSEFSVDGVSKWEAGGIDTLSDTEYQIGFATYEKETIFGKQPVVGKCLIRDGIVKKWVYAKTGADIP